MKRLDIDGNGKVSFEEMVTFMSSDSMEAEKSAPVDMTGGPDRSIGNAGIKIQPIAQAFGGEIGRFQDIYSMHLDGAPDDDSIQRRRMLRREVTRLGMGKRLLEKSTMKSVFASLDSDLTGLIPFNLLRKTLAGMGMEIVMLDYAKEILQTIEKTGDRVKYEQFEKFLTTDYSKTKVEMFDEALIQERRQKMVAHKPEKEVHMMKWDEGLIPARGKWDKMANGKMPLRLRKTSAAFGHYLQSHIKQTAVEMRNLDNRKVQRDKLKARLKKVGLDRLWTRCVRPKLKKVSISDDSPWQKIASLSDEERAAEIPFSRLKYVLQDYGMGLILEDSEYLMKELDLDQNGKISYKEVQMFIEKDPMEAAEQVDQIALNFKMGRGDEQYTSFRPNGAQINESLLGRFEDLYSMHLDGAPDEDNVTRRKLLRLEQLRQKIAGDVQKGDILAALFQKLGAGDGGSVHFQALKDGLKEIGFDSPLLTEHARDLIPSLDPKKGTNTTTLADFMKFLDSDQSQFKINKFDKGLEEERRNQMVAHSNNFDKDARLVFKWDEGRIQPTSEWDQYASGKIQVRMRKTSAALGFDAMHDIKSGRLDARVQENRNHHRKEVKDRLLSDLKAFWKKCGPEIIEDPMTGQKFAAISFRMFKRVLDQEGLSIVHQDSHDLMRKIDTDGDGKISFEELEALLRADPVAVSNAARNAEVQNEISIRSRAKVNPKKLPNMHFFRTTTVQGMRDRASHSARSSRLQPVLPPPPQKVHMPRAPNSKNPRKLARYLRQLDKLEQDLHLQQQNRNRHWTRQRFKTHL